MDHDQRFKILLQVFFTEFLLLFFRAWAELLDAEKVEWLDKELFPDPPEGRRRTLDLVGKVPTRKPVPGQRPGEPAEHWLALVHIEIESPETVRPVRPRMHEAYFNLRQRYQMPVLPIAVFLHVGLNGVGTDVYEERFWDLQALRFEYLYVGLPGLDGIKYVQGDNWLGVALAALMRIPPDKVAWLGAEALRRIQETPVSEHKRFLLGECVQAYLPLDETQQQEFERLLTTEPYRGVKAVNTTWYERGLQEGRAQGGVANTTWYERGLQEGRELGITEGKRAMLRTLLEERFGPIPPEVHAALERLPAERLHLLYMAAIKAQSLRELNFDA